MIGLEKIKDIFSSKKIQDILSSKKIKDILSSVKTSGPAFGLDIGTSSIKAVEIKRSWPQKGTRLSFAIVEVAQGAEKEATISAIEQTVKNLGTSSRRVNLSLSGPDIITRYMLLPKMQEKDLVSAMEFELTKYIPHKLEDMVIDYQIIDRSLDTQMAVLVVGVERKLIAGRVSLIRQAGLEAQSVSVDCFVIMEAFQRANPSIVKNKESAIALLEIGHKISKLAVLENNILRFSRDITFAGYNFTKAISERMNVDLKSAEELKRSLKERSEEIDRIIQSNLASILDEVHMSFDYCERLIQHKISGLYLSGGGARLKDIEAFMSSALEMEVNFWNPLTNFQFPPDLPKEELQAKSSVLPVAVGLALS